MGERAWDIGERTIHYSLMAMKLYRELKNGDGVAQVIGKQFLRSATSIGANVVEAKSGESRRDFIHKYSVAQKEARESAYWLQLLLRGDIVAPDRLTPLIDETAQLIAVLTAIIVKTKQRPS